MKTSFKIIFMFLLTSTCFLHGENKSIEQTKKMIINGDDFYDSRGKKISAHGGGFLKVGNYYYWIGENRGKGVLVSCYRSKNLLNWEFRGDLLTRKSHPELDKANIERPKVIYNKKTKQFVMWMHYEYGKDYSSARVAVATSPNIEKPFHFLKSFRPFNNMSRDCTLFKDDDGTAYFLSTARENYDMIMYKLTDNYLDIRKQIAILWPGGHREAPALVKRGSCYFIITSACTGWIPNQAKYAYAKSITGPWSKLKNIGNATTYNSQSTYILTVYGKGITNYLYVGDRWDSKNYSNSSYIFLPLKFINDTTMELNWVDKIIPNIHTGSLE